MSFACCLGAGQVLSNVISGLPNNYNMQLPIDSAALTNALAKLPHAQIARAVSVIALVYIAYVCAQITWQIVGSSSSTTSNVSTFSNVSAPSKQHKLNLEPLISLNLFGQANSKPAVVEQPIEDAPETSLQLTLSGVVASDDRNAAAAIIEHKGKQETYGIGDKITDTRAILERVYVDRVIIEQSGRMETLMLDGFDYHSPVALRNNSEQNEPDSQNARVIDQRGNLSLTNQATLLKEDIVDDPAKISAYLNISPKQVDGEVVGFDLKPGRDGEFFKASGLKFGDVAVQMNGLDLTDPSQVQQALQLLKVEQEISLLVERNGELTEILFSIENE